MDNGLYSDLMQVNRMQASFALFPKAWYNETITSFSIAKTGLNILSV